MLIYAHLETIKIIVINNSER